MKKKQQGIDLFASLDFNIKPNSCLDNETNVKEMFSVKEKLRRLFKFFFRNSRFVLCMLDK
jgi:hypothetical protein